MKDARICNMQYEKAIAIKKRDHIVVFFVRVLLVADAPLRNHV